jgi:hypothetical protein
VLVLRDPALLSVREMSIEDDDSVEERKLLEQFQALQAQLSILSKQKPHDPVNAFKLNFVNILLEQANAYLRENYRPFDNFTVFDPESLPTNSDVVVILSQYIQCVELQYNYDLYGSEG